MEAVLITGGTGLVGNYLSELLASEGFEVIHLSRSAAPESAYMTITWQPEKGIIDSVIPSNTKHIIHLAGAGIGEGRWTNSRKQKIISSRTETVKLLHKTAESQKLDIKTFITASATGYYGSLTSEQIFNESDDPGNDFTAEVCSLWEDAAGEFKESGSRLVIIRTGVVLDPDRGALPRMAKPVKLGMATPVGSGSQYIPWIHPADLSAIYLAAIRNSELHGPYNAVAPSFITNSEFMKLLAKQLGRKYINLPVPSLLLKLVFGEMSAIVLEGSRISSEKIIGTGFRFKYPDP